MKKIILWVLVILLIGGAVATYIIYKKNNPTAGEGQMVVKGQSGQIVIRDIYQAPSPAQKPLVFGAKDAQITKTSDFDLIYFAKDQSFLITLTIPDVKKARMEAEQTLLSNLQIDQSTACKLKVSVGVPYDVSPDQSGQNLGLSFCPNGKPL